MAGIPLPTPGSIPPFIPDTGPTYTQIFNDTMGDLGTDQDAFPGLFAALQSLSNSFGAELAADQAIGPIATLGGVPGILDPAPLDTTIGNYVATVPTGEGIVTDITPLAPPELLELPMASTFGEGAAGPPGQFAYDFGTVKLNSPTQTYNIGSKNISTRRVTGMVAAQVVTPFNGVLVLAQDDETSGVDGTGDVFWNMVLQPVALGAFTTQVNTVGGTPTGVAIFTFTVNVVQ